MDLSRRSLALWEAMIAEDGNACEHDRKGSVLVARDAAQAAALKAHIAAPQAEGVECYFYASGWGEIAPALGPAAAGIRSPRIEASAVALLPSFGLVAALLPAARAVRVDPIVALRYE